MPLLWKRRSDKIETRKLRGCYEPLAKSRLVRALRKECSVDEGPLPIHQEKRCQSNNIIVPPFILHLILLICGPEEHAKSLVTYLEFYLLFNWRTYGYFSGKNYEIKHNQNIMVGE